MINTLKNKQDGTKVKMFTSERLITSFFAQSDHAHPLLNLRIGITVDKN